MNLLKIYKLLNCNTGSLCFFMLSVPVRLNNNNKDSVATLDPFGSSMNVQVVLILPQLKNRVIMAFSDSM